LAASKAKLLEMALKDKERMMLEEAKNRVESYIYYVKNKLMDEESAIEKVSTKKQREEAEKLALDAEEWLDNEGHRAALATLEDKYAVLSAPFEKIMLRVKEATNRPEAIKSLEKKLEEVETLMNKWETTMPQVNGTERGAVLEKVELVRKWIADAEGKQAKKKPHDEPAFLSAEVPVQAKDLEVLVVQLSKKPKPKPTKKEKVKKEGNTTESSANATEGIYAAPQPDGNSTGGNSTETGSVEGDVKTDNTTKEAGETKMDGIVGEEL
jgi:hypoxia up-regulated 1